MKLALHPIHSGGPMALIGLSLLFYLLGDATTESMAFQRDMLEQGQLWRLLTANLLHTNGIHWLLNCAGLGVIWALHGHYYRWSQFLWLMLLLSVGTTLGVYLFSPHLLWYVGLSGALHGLCIWGGYQDTRHGHRSGYVLIVAVIVKVIYEQQYGGDATVAQLIDANVAIDAHLWGAVTALLMIMGWTLWRLHNRKNGTLLSQDARSE